MYIISKMNIEKVEVLQKYNDNSLVKFYSNELLLPNSNVYSTYHQAKMAKREIKLVKDFKKNKSDRNNYACCEYCGTKLHISQATVDHVKPISAFGGRSKLREDIDKWGECWTYENFAICCTECNEMKASMNYKQFLKDVNIVDYAARLLNYNKTKKIANDKYSQCRKIGYKICTSSKGKSHKVSDVTALKLAKSDSNIIRMDIILNSH